MAIKINYKDGESYTGAQLTEPMKALLSDGVYNVSGGAFLVSANSPADLSVKVALGKATKNGLFIDSDAIVTVPIVANTSGFNRIDIIVIDVSTDTIIAVEGTGSSSPTAPLPTTDQLVLAQVLVGNNVSVIESANITDNRVSCEKANKTQQTPITAALLNSWVVGNGGGLKYFKDDFGIVHIYGEIKDGTVASGTIIATLPVGFRPAITIPIYGIKSNDGSWTYFAVDVDGNLRIYGTLTVGVFRLNGSFVAVA